jgi:mono/diheme cytochrome c family protein
MFVLATTQRSIGLVLVVLLALGLIVWLVVNVRSSRAEVGSEIELAPNKKPYYSDEEMEGLRLDRYLSMALGLLAIIALGLPLYWIAEPGRMSGAVEMFDRTFVARGTNLYEENCSSCHGPAGAGGVASYILNDKDGNYADTVVWLAPALDSALLRFDREEITYVLDHGRPFSPMQPWSIVGGGAMNSQAVDNIIDYLASVTLTPNQARDDVEEGVIARLVSERAAGLRADRRLDPPAEVTQALAADEALVRQAFQAAGSQAGAIAQLERLTDTAARARLGELLFNNVAAGGAYSCARCHTAGWSFGNPGPTGGGAFGPSLLGVERKFRGDEDFALFIARGCDEAMVYGVVAPDGSQAQCKSGQMPGFGNMYTSEQLDAVVAYVGTLDGTQTFAFDPEG